MKKENPFLVSLRLMRRSKLVFSIDLNARCHAIYIRRIISIRPYARKINNIDERDRAKKSWNDPHFHYNADRLSHYIYFCLFFFQGLFIVRSKFSFFPNSMSSIVQLSSEKLYLCLAKGSRVTMPNAAAESEKCNCVVYLFFCFSLVELLDRVLAFVVVGINAFI